MTPKQLAEKIQFLSEADKNKEIIFFKDGKIKILDGITFANPAKASRLGKAIEDIENYTCIFLR